LTSDVEKKVLNRWKNNPAEFASQQLYLAQSPHHGAKGNHSQVFWKQFIPGNGSKIVISVGENSYQHPSKETLKYFTSKGFKVLTTQEGEVLSSNTIETSQLLDIFSKKRVTIQAKDICFKISQSGEINILS
jgi:beta-lactamase superfamily II metal-dependent hydrolase